MVTKRRNKPTAKPIRKVEFEQVPPEEAKVLLDLALDAVIAMSGKALKELEKY